MVINLPETRLGISQKLRRINSIKFNHNFFQCTCLRVFFCSEKLKINGNVTNFPGLLPLHLLLKYLGLFYQID